MKYKKMANEEIKLTQRQINVAVAQYLTDMGVDRAAIKNMLARKIEDRNPGQMVREYVQHYFRKGPGGFRATEIVESRIRQDVDAHVRNALRDGAYEALDDIIKDHVSQIVAGAEKPKLRCMLDGCDTALYLSAKAMTGKLSAECAGMSVELHDLKVIVDRTSWEIRARNRTMFQTDLITKLNEYFGITIDDWTAQADGYARINENSANELIRRIYGLSPGRAVVINDGVLFLEDPNTNEKYAGDAGKGCDDHEHET